MRARLLVGMALALAAAVMTGAWAREPAPSPQPVLPARQTIDDLQSAYQCETTAQAKYTAYALQARVDGFPDVAALFRAAAASERIDARNCLAVLKKLGVSVDAGSYEKTPGLTADNLWEALTTESFERDYVYPEMVKHARSEGQNATVRVFTYAIHAETQHVGLYRHALDNLAVSPKPVVYYVAPGCGGTYANTPPAFCPMCGAPAARFGRFE